VSGVPAFERLGGVFGCACLRGLKHRIELRDGNDDNPFLVSDHIVAGGNLHTAAGDGGVNQVKDILAAGDWDDAACENPGSDSLVFQRDRG